MATKKSKVQLVIDCGNGNIKVMVNGEWEIIPSIYSHNNGNYIRGGFQLNGVDYIVGWDNEHRTADKYAIVDQDNGKIENLDILICGAVSAMSYVIPAKSKVELHILTLNANQEDKIREKILGIQSFSKNKEDLGMEFSIGGIYPEGYGACVYGQNRYPDHKHVAVLDIGNGTLNLATYMKGQRQSLSFAPKGYRSVIEAISEIMAEEMSNGAVDENLIRNALDRNTYLYRSDFKGRNIRKQTDKAIEHWLHDKKVKPMILKVIDLIEQGIPVVTCGGGFQCEAIANAFKKIIGVTDLFHIPESPIMLGVRGLYEDLAK